MKKYAVLYRGFAQAKTRLARCGGNRREANLPSAGCHIDKPKF